MPGSYAGRLIAYFRHNPDEFLTTADLKAKLGPVANLATSLRSAVDSGYIDKQVEGRVSAPPTAPGRASCARSGTPPTN